LGETVIFKTDTTLKDCVVHRDKASIVPAKISIKGTSATFHLCGVSCSICKIFIRASMAEGYGGDVSQHLPMLMVMQRSFWLLDMAKIIQNP